MSWADLPCDPRVARELSACLRSNRLSPSLLLCGPPGTGKRAVAVAVAQALLCLGTEPPCGNCKHCRRVASGQHPDFKVWEADGREVRVEQARALRAATRLRPFEGRVQVHLVPEAERMNEEASNALLRTLEEPSPHAVLILLTIAPSLLLPTIRSRCQSFRFRPLPARMVQERLEKDGGVPAEEARWRARLARGSLARARSLPADEIELAHDVARTLESMLEQRIRGRLAASIVDAAERWSSETPAERPLERLLEVCRDALLAHHGAPVDSLLYPELGPRLGRMAGRLAGTLPAGIQRLEAALGDLRRPMKGNLLIEESLSTLMHRP
ncbi:MAG: DNA polymerase III subunit delta' [Acidobacteria bacterium]|nr:DNA polymerase III subunit delta' [Acidobacteriota bacterium]